MEPSAKLFQALVVGVSLTGGAFACSGSTTVDDTAALDASSDGAGHDAAADAADADARITPAFDSGYAIIMALPPPDSGVGVHTGLDATAGDAASHDAAPSDAAAMADSYGNIRPAGDF